MCGGGGERELHKISFLLLTLYFLYTPGTECPLGRQEPLETTSHPRCETEMVIPGHVNR